MKNKIITILLFIFSTFFISNVYAEYEVICKEIKSFFIQNGKSNYGKGIYEVHFIVDEDNNIITRTKVINLNTDEVTPDNSVYQVIHNKKEFLGYRYFGVLNPTGFLGFILPLLDKEPERVEQKIIKAFGQVGMIDGYEILVIGEDFVIQSKSTLNYIAVVHSKCYKQKEY